MQDRCCRSYPARCWSAAHCSIHWFWNLVCLIWNTWPTVHNQQFQNAYICCSIKEVEVTRLRWHYTVYFSSISLISELQKYYKEAFSSFRPVQNEDLYSFLHKQTGERQEDGDLWQTTKEMHTVSHGQSEEIGFLRKVTIHCTNQCEWGNIDLLQTVIDKHKMVLRTWAHSPSGHLQRNLWTCSQQMTGKKNKE